MDIDFSPYYAVNQVSNGRYTPNVGRGFYRLQVKGFNKISPIEGVYDDWHLEVSLDIIAGKRKGYYIRIPFAIGDSGQEERRGAKKSFDRMVAATLGGGYEFPSKFSEIVGRRFIGYLDLSYVEEEGGSVCYSALSYCLPSDDFTKTLHPSTPAHLVHGEWESAPRPDGRKVKSAHYRNIAAHANEFNAEYLSSYGETCSLDIE